jgi:MFS family permease
VLAGFATIGGLLFGFDISSMSAWIGTDQYTDYFNHPDADLQGIITASMSLGSFAGSLAAGPLSDKLGRKLALVVACIIWIVGSIVTATTHSVGQLIAGRVINGLSVGITSSQVPVYLSELSRKEIRGRVVGIQQWSIEWGILIMFFISYGCSFIKGTTSFRLAWGLQAVPAAILLAVIPFFPESPRWFAEKGRWDECREILIFLHGETEVSQIEFEEIKLQVEAERSAGNGWLGLFGKDLFMYKRITVGVFAQLWQQMLGGNVMMYYIVYVFEMAGLT